MRNDFKFTHEIRDGVIVNVFFDFDIKTATKKHCKLTLDIDSLVLLGKGDIPVVGLTGDEFKALQSEIDQWLEDQAEENGWQFYEDYLDSRGET
jgi:hypothetical protein